MSTAPPLRPAPAREASVLIVDDDATTRHALTMIVSRSGWNPLPVENGAAALALLGDPGGPRVALVDWMMPDLSGIELCQTVRGREAALAPYLILVTVRSASADVVAGLDAGADDYLVKPIDAGELRARVRVGLRTMDLRDRLVRRAHQLETALAEVRQLRSLLPTCSYCRRIRDDQDGWQSLEEYVSHHTDTKFSHGFCPDCFARYVQPQLDTRLEGRGQKE
ncbi:MAG: response regulator transcription factor [Vicinamibacterales bacterium]